MNSQIKQFEEQFNSGRLAQSFLVIGPERTGKFSAVIEMISIVNDFDKDQTKLIEQGMVPDIIFIETEKESSRRQKLMKQDNNVEGNKDSQANKKEKKKKPKDRISKKQIDEAMKNVALKNFQLNKKVIVIRGADKLTNTAANSLLKLIEEPTSNLIIFLLANSEDDLLVTIKSRCQFIKFSFLDDGSMKSLINQEYAPSKEDTASIVELARGRVELAREYSSNISLMRIAEKTRDNFRKALRGGKVEQLNLVDSLIKEGDDLLWVLNEWVWYLKFFLEENIEKGQSLAVIKKIYEILNELLKTRELIKVTNVNKKAQLENFFVQI